MDVLYGDYLKRAIDFSVALAGLLLLSPLLLAISVLVKCWDGGPVLFKQQRLGKGGRQFVLWKFRSMTHNPHRRPEDDGKLVEDHPEITAIGRVMRRWKIDELPQLFNVLRGHMSLIGPRPCLPSLGAEFDEFGRKRLDARPGCTGLAQTCGGIELSWPERWKYDAYYLDHLSLALDAKVVFRTIVMLIRGEKRMLLGFDEYLARQGRRFEQAPAECGGPIRAMPIGPAGTGRDGDTETGQRAA